MPSPHMQGAGIQCLCWQPVFWVCTKCVKL